MTAAYLVLLMPLIAIIVLLSCGDKPYAGRINSLFSILTLLATIWLVGEFKLKGASALYYGQFYLDAFNICFLLLTAFIGATTAIFSDFYMYHNLIDGKINAKLYQLYHVLYQAFILAMVLVLLANNIGILWVSMEGATLTTALLVSLYRTPEAIEAAWKYFVLCIVGIALALFGTVCIYFSAQNVPMASGTNALLWSNLYAHAHILDPQVLTLAFVFLFIGYGTKAGLVPFHYWLPDAHSESPAPMSALLSGLLLNLGLYSLLRFKMIVDQALGYGLTSQLMMIFGLLSFFIGSLFMYRQKNIKRMFSYSSIEHIGLITFAFGLNNRLATFAAIFYMIVHSLVKSATFMSVGNVIMMFKTQSMDKIRGVMQLNPIIGWGLIICTVAICGFPPFAIFNSEFIILLSTVQTHLWLALLILLGLLIALVGILRNLHPVIYGKANVDPYMGRISFWPIVIHLVLALWLGLCLPVWFANILQQAANLLSGGA